MPDDCRLVAGFSANYQGDAPSNWLHRFESLDGERAHEVTGAMLAKWRNEGKVEFA